MKYFYSTVATTSIVVGIFLLMFSGLQITTIGIMIFGAVFVVAADLTEMAEKIGKK